MFYTVLGNMKADTGTYSALLDLETCSAAQAAERIVAANGCKTILVGKYLAFNAKYELDRDAIYAALDAAGLFTDDKDTTEYWLFNLMRLYHGSMFLDIRRMEGTELHRRFKEFLEKYLPDATYKLDLDSGLKGNVAHLDFKFFLGDDAYHFMFLIQADGTEQLILYWAGTDCRTHQIRIANPSVAKERIDAFISKTRESR